MKVLDLKKATVLNIRETFGSVTDKKILSHVSKGNKPMVLCTQTGECKLYKQGRMLGMNKKLWVN